jgi:S1-C subfamily serine protease
MSRELFYVTSILFSIVVAFETEYRNLSTTSAGSPKKLIHNVHEIDNLGSLYNLKVLNGSRQIYNSDNDVKTLTTRQIPNATNLYKQNVKSVVLIGNKKGIGAGIIISDDEILTNFHVVEGAETVDLVLYNPNYTSLSSIDKGDIFTGDVIAVDSDRDIALVKTNRYLKNKVKFGQDWRIDIASDVFAIGHPSGLWGFTYGVISALPKPKEWTYDGDHFMKANCIQTQTPINPGNSGGPLYNHTGKLIGMNTSTADGEGLNFAVRLNELNDFISKARNGEYPKGEKEKELEWIEIKDHTFEDIDSFYGADSNDDGSYDIWLVYEDKDDNVDIRLFDLNFDGDADIIHIIKDNLFYIDENYDGEYETLGRDTDDDWWPDEFKDYEG